MKPNSNIFRQKVFNQYHLFEFELKKIFCSIIIILSLSLINGQHIYLHLNESNSSELNNPDMISHQHFEDCHDNHDFYLNKPNLLNFVLHITSDMRIRIFEFSPQNYSSFIWQPPEIIL